MRGTPLHVCVVGGGFTGAAAAIACAARIEHPFRLTIVEPGGTRTGFLTGMQFTEESEPYRDTAVGHVRRSLTEADASSMSRWRSASSATP